MEPDENKSAYFPREIRTPRPASRSMCCATLWLCFPVRSQTGVDPTGKSSSGYAESKETVRGSCLSYISLSPPCEECITRVTLYYNCYTFDITECSLEAGWKHSPPRADLRCGRFMSGPVHLHGPASHPIQWRDQRLSRGEWEGGLNK